MDSFLQGLASKGKVTALGMVENGQKFLASLVQAKQPSIFNVHSLQPFNGQGTIGAIVASGVLMLFLRYTLPHNPAGSCSYLERISKDTLSKGFAEAECKIQQRSEVFGNIIFFVFPLIAVLIIEALDCKAKLKKYTSSQNKSMNDKLSKLKKKVEEKKKKRERSDDDGREPDMKSFIIKEIASAVDEMLSATQLNLSEFSNSFKSHFADTLIQLIAIAGLVVAMFLFKDNIAEKETQFQCPVLMPTGELLTFSCIYPSVFYTKIEVGLALYVCLPAVMIVFLITICIGCAKATRHTKKLQYCGSKLASLIQEWRDFVETLNDKNSTVNFYWVDEDNSGKLNDKLSVFERTTEIEYEAFEEGVKELLRMLGGVNF